MKKFKFALETVLSYKQQVLDALQGEQAILMAQVYEQEQLLGSLQRLYSQEAEEYRTGCAQGMEMRDVMTWQTRLRAREREIEAESARLEELKQLAEKKRQEVVVAKQDTSSIEKLKEKQLDSYHAAEAKNEEKFIEEFVSSRRSAQEGA